MLSDIVLRQFLNKCDCVLFSNEKMATNSHEVIQVKYGYQVLFNNENMYVQETVFFIQKNLSCN